MSGAGLGAVFILGPGSSFCTHLTPALQHCSIATLQTHVCKCCLGFVYYMRRLVPRCHVIVPPPVSAQYHHIMNVTITAALAEHFSPCHRTPSHHHTLPCSVSKQFAASVARTEHRHEASGDLRTRAAHVCSMVDI